MLKQKSYQWCNGKHPATLHYMWYYKEEGVKCISINTGWDISVCSASKITTERLYWGFGNIIFTGKLYSGNFCCVKILDQPWRVEKENVELSVVCVCVCVCVCVFVCVCVIDNSDKWSTSGYRYKTRIIGFNPYTHIQKKVFTSW